MPGRQLQTRKITKNCKCSSNNSENGAFYYCVLVFIRHENDPTPIIGTGEWHGSIVQTPSGQNGFGYDPYFWLEEYNCTAAELLPEKKNQISHRAQASQDLSTKLQKSVFDAIFSRALHSFSLVYQKMSILRFNSHPIKVLRHKKSTSKR